MTTQEAIDLIEAHEERKKTPEGKKEYEALLKRILEAPVGHSQSD